MTHHLALASRLPPGADYSLFKEGIFPDWEDERNSGGGRWLVGVDRLVAGWLAWWWLGGQPGGWVVSLVVAGWLAATGGSRLSP